MAPQEPHGGLTVRALVVAALAALWACGGSPKQTETAPEPAPSAKERACNRYGLRIGPFMRRLDSELGKYVDADKLDADTTDRADAARNLASFIDAEVPGLYRIGSVDPQLNAAHLRLVQSLEETGRALEQLAAAYVLEDRKVMLMAKSRRDESLFRWSEASRAIVTQCNE